MVTTLKMTFTMHTFQWSHTSDLILSCHLKWTDLRVKVSCLPAQSDYLLEYSQKILLNHIKGLDETYLNHNI